ncbi:MAG: CapA family protein [Chloroflexota bacterium]|nr:CapA family protein [Chloroflexota bacterium]
MQRTSDDLLGRKVTRRTVGLGAAALGLSAVAPGSVGEAIAAPVQMPAVIRAAPQAAVPDGMALVSSPRLPLYDLASQDVGALVSGGIPTWLEVGSALDMPVVPAAIEGVTMDGLAPAETFADFGELSDWLNSPDGFGGVALVPVEQVDVTVSVLAVDGFDPLRNGEGADPITRIGFVGDIVPGRNVGIKMRQYNDYTHPFHRVANLLKSYDLTVANLEGNLSDNLQVPSDGATFDFLASTEMLAGFEMAGIDVASLANNHSTWNNAGWGTQGLTDTMDALDAYGIGRMGAGVNLSDARAPFTTEIAGLSIAMIGIDGVTANVEEREINATVYQSWKGGERYAGATGDSPGTYPYDPELFLADIEELAAGYDIVIPYFHYGIEYSETPPAWAVQGARDAIDRGATCVVTNHPHVIQGMEIYNGKPVLYSVGNFIFDQMFSVQTRQGLILELVMRGDRCVGLRTRGVEIEDYNQPRLMSAGEQAAIMDRFWRGSDRIAQI